MKVLNASRSVLLPKSRSAAAQMKFSADLAMARAQLPKSYVMFTFTCSRDSPTIGVSDFPVVNDATKTPDRIEVSISLTIFSVDPRNRYRYGALRTIAGCGPGCRNI